MSDREDAQNHTKTRQERRSEKLRRRRDRMTQHGRSLVRIYKNAMLKNRKKDTE